MKTNTNTAAAAFNATSMERAFRLVDPTCEPIGRDWKDPIGVFGSEKAIEAACSHLSVTLDDVIASVEFYTATVATVTRSNGQIRITAPGYRAGPAGDH